MVAAQTPSSSGKGATLTQSHQEILLSQKLNVIPRLRRTGVHKVPPLLIQTSYLENVNHIMDILLVQPVRQHRACQVRMALEVVVAAAENRVDVRITTRAEEIVYASTVLILAVPVQRVLDDGGQRAHVRQIGPEAVARRNVAGVKLLGATRPEAFAGVVRVPNVQIACGQDERPLF